MKLWIIATAIALALISPTLAAPPTTTDDNLLKNLKPTHPRLLVTDTTWDDLRKNRTTDADLDLLLKKIATDATTILDTAPVLYEKEGRRLLAVSRLAIRRIWLLSFQYQISRDKKFLDRAEKEMLTVSETFTDWNPPHFLDTAEMTAALAIGYDWLYNDLTPQSRATIRKAIVERGLQLGLNPKEKINWWHTAKNNWNQVCIGGLSLGALAIADEEPAIATQILKLGKENIHNGLEPYAPAGVYPEGPGYWGYGTTYQVLLIAALESALGTDWDLCKSPGFLESSQYYLQATSPTLQFFNYSDCGIKSGEEPILHWFAKRTSNPGLLYFENKLLKKLISTSKEKDGNRFTPLAAIWWQSTPSSTPPTIPLSWYGKGKQPIAIFRTSWTDPNALYLALKGGSPSLNHGHMDAGSFVLDCDGERWGSDLGAQNYESLESKGIKLWSSKQDSDRWKVFRLNNFSHSTLTINEQLHNSQGQAPIIRFSPEEKNPHAVVDLTQIFQGQATKVTRGFKILPNRQILIQDELEGLKPNDNIRWAMTTKANIKVKKNRATLKQNGKYLQAQIITPTPARFEVIPATPPSDDFNAPNPDTYILTVNAQVPDSGKLQIAILLHPGDSPIEWNTPLTSPETWSSPISE